VFHFLLALVPVTVWLRPRLLSWMSSRSLLSNHDSTGVVTKTISMLCPCLCPAVDHHIFRACEESDGLESVRAVLRRDPGAVNKQRREDLATPLHVAAVLQDCDLVRLLLSSGAEAGGTDKDGRTALHVAALSGNGDIVSLLLESIPLPALDAPTRHGHTALFLACWRGHLDVAQLLHGRGANVNQIDAEGKSMIDRARGWNQTRVVAWLTELRDQALAPPAIRLPPEDDEEEEQGGGAGKAEDDLGDLEGGDMA